MLLSKNESLKILLWRLRFTWLQLPLTDQVEGLVARGGQLRDKGLEIGAVVVEVELDMHPLEDDIGQEDSREGRGQEGTQNPTLETLHSKISRVLSVLSMLKLMVL